KVVTITGVALAGADAPNYTLTQPTTTANITKAPSPGTLVSSVNPSGPGTNVIFTATISAGPPAPGSPPPTGNVVFLTNNVVLGTVPLDGSGVAAANTSSLPIGTNTVTARYAGDATFLGATNSLQQVVKVFVTLSQTNVILSIVDNHDTSLTLNMLC